MSTAYQPLINKRDGNGNIYDIEGDGEVDDDDDEEVDGDDEDDDVVIMNIAPNGRTHAGKGRRYYYNDVPAQPQSKSKSWISNEIEDNSSSSLPNRTMTTTTTTTSNGNRNHSGSFSWPSQGNRRGLIMALGVAFILVLLVLLVSVYVETKSIDSADELSSGANDWKAAISVRDFLDGRFNAHRFNASWISDDELQYFNENGDLTIYNVKEGVKTVILSAEVMAENLNGYRPFECLFSADRRFLLLGYFRQQIFRHSSVAKYEIYDIEMREFIPLVPSLTNDESNEAARFHQLVVWSTVGNGLAFVHFSNVYYKTSARSRESSQLTFDENTMNVFNGITDWVYEEEMFATSTALWFSPGGSNMAFVTFNDTAVEKIHYPIYGSSENLLQYPYPHVENLSYPKSGRRNPTARITLVSFNDNRTITNEMGQEMNQFRMLRNVQFPNTPIEHYIGGVKWATDSKLLVITLNRHQNDSRTHLCDTQGNCDTILTTLISNGWIDVEIPHISTAGDSFLTLTSQTQKLTQDGSSGSGRIPTIYRHILQFFKDSTQNRPATSGLFSVDSILGWDQSAGRIYFKAPGYNISSKIATPSQTHLWYADTNSKSTDDNLICLTCPLKTSHGEPCLGNAVELSTGFSYFVLTCNNGPYSPPEISVRSTKNAEPVLLEWDSNSKLRSDLATIKLPTYKDFEIELPSEYGNPFKIRARIFLPPNLVKSKKYPLFVDVYGGPGSQRISDSYVMDWSASLVTSHSVIYASIDGRGSGRQSDDLKFQIYRRLGTVEIFDQIGGGEWLVKNVPYIDANRTAIWGWSYGGFATALVMGLDSIKNVYKCGISVAPVTNWLLYDTIYTERYMGLPTANDNWLAYNKSDVTHYVENFRTKKYYLVHGNADDNVHYQQSMILSRALERADILFRQQSYPDESHGLSGVRAHLYHSLENFLFEECF